MSTQDCFWLIIYVRGFAMSQSEINETTADPFCGFNLGSTSYRAALDRDRPARKFVFESPVVRLRSDFEYEDVFEQGLDIMDPGWSELTQLKGISKRSVVIYRYYEQASTLLGKGKTPDIEQFASGLSELIERVRDLVCSHPDNKVARDECRCYLVAHSMGGLVVRAFLQNRNLGSDEARACVDKVFTYATPHNGIEMAGINVPSWVTKGDIANFNRERMADYLNLKTLYEKTGRVDWMPDKAFPSERVFCMVGTNRADYEVAQGLSRTFAGHGSDGLVRIENASVWGTKANGTVSAPCATAYAFRSHSGFFGIVNSEESYQNLIRFLFGNVRVDVWADVASVRLPPSVQAEADKGRPVNAQYQFEVLASPRGARWYLTRRIAEEDSVAVRTHSDLTGKDEKAKTVYLSTVFLGDQWKINKQDPSLAYSLTLTIRVPEYEVEKKFWPDGHFEGRKVFSDTVIVRMTPPAVEDGDWDVSYDWLADTLDPKNTPVSAKALKGGKLELKIPFGVSATDPNAFASGSLRLIASAWNDEYKSAK